MRIAIIGAGAAGLCAGKHCQDENIDFDIFEQTGNIGGIWNYTDHTEIDENGIPVHSPMYQGLRTNLPREVMIFEGLSYPSSMKNSYITQEQVLDYLGSYCRKYNLQKHVKFFKTVSKVDPQDHGSWLVEFKELKTLKTEAAFYNAVFICNGHYKTPFVPKIPGLETFPFESWEHSCKYRSADKYQNKRVLVLGSGPSGVDISKQISTTASNVFLSVRSKTFLPPSDGVVIKCTIKEINGHNIMFEDGSSEIVDSIILCTGYLYDFPFLTEKCGIQVKDNCVNPLYKHLININHPTMAFIGLNFKICPFPLFDIQVRFFIASLLGHFQLPDKDEMLKDLEVEMKNKSEIPLKNFHMVGEKQEEYFNELADFAGIKRVIPVISKLYNSVLKRRNLDDCFKIVDDENFIQTA